MATERCLLFSIGAARVALMELKQWLDAERGRQARLAELLTADNPSRPIVPTFVSVMGNRSSASGRPVPPRLAPGIERHTEGAVMRWDLRPDDWWEIWPELRDRRGAPDVPLLVAEDAAA